MFEKSVEAVQRLDGRLQEDRSRSRQINRRRRRSTDRAGMNIHEYQAKAVLREFGVPVSRGIAAFTVDEAVKAANEARRPGLGGEGADPCRRPRQGRRRQGACKSVDEVRKEAERLLGTTLVTHQTGPQGKEVQPALYRGRLDDRARVLSLRAGRPRDLAGRLRRLDRRRHGHRGGGARRRRRRSSPFSVDPATGCMPHHRPPASPRRSGSTATSPSRPSS